MKTSWEKHPYYAHITPYEVVVGSNPGSTGHTDNAGSCTHKEFLKGRHQDIVRKELGEDVLSEMIAAVKQAKRNIVKPDERIKAVRSTDKHHVKAWKRIPKNKRLCTLAAQADENGFRDNYGYGPDGTTIVHLDDDVTLTLGSMSNDAHFTFADGSTKQVSIPTGPAIGHNGYAYVERNGIAVYDTSGALVFHTGTPGEGMYETHGLGSTYRFTNILRAGDTIIAEYRNGLARQSKKALRVLGERGYLEVDPLRGIVSRCTIKEK